MQIERSIQRFGLIVIPFAIFFFGVFALAKSVRFQPWTRTGQEEQYKEYRKIIAIPTPPADAPQVPLLECEESTFDFGTMPPFVDGEHVFNLKNAGNLALAVKGARESCSCLKADLPASIVEPGESREMKVKWNTDKAGPFAQFVTIHSNCPGKEEFQLWVKGNVATILNATTGGLGFEDLLPGESRSQEFYLYSDLWDSINVERIETSSDQFRCELTSATMDNQRTLLEKRNEKEPKHKTSQGLSLTALPRDTSGTLRGYVRLFVRPPLNSLPSDGTSASALSLRGMTNSLQNDGTLLIQLPVELTVKRRFGLFSPIITDADRREIDLGKLRTSDSQGKSWSIVARIRGDVRPTDFVVQLTGIPGIKASIEKPTVSASGFTKGTSYRINLNVEERLRPAIYNRENAGKLKMECPGLVGEEVTEFTVDLDVLPDDH